MPVKVMYLEFDPDGGESVIKNIDAFSSLGRARSEVERFNSGSGRQQSNGRYMKAFVEGGKIEEEISLEEAACVRRAVAASKINALGSRSRSGVRPSSARVRKVPSSSGPSAAVRHAAGVGPSKRHLAGDVHTPGPRRTEASRTAQEKAMIKKHLLIKKLPPVQDGELRILVTGSRDWPETRADTIRDTLMDVFNQAGLPLKNILVIVGEADGADTIVHRLCHTHFGVACAQFYAPWEQHRRDYGNPRAAGPLRNGWMLRWGKPNMVLAFHPYITNSRGTKNTIEQARKLGINVRIIE